MGEQGIAEVEVEDEALVFSVIDGVLVRMLVEL